MTDSPEKAADEDLFSRSEIIEDLVKSWDHSYKQIHKMDGDNQKLEFLKLNFDGILERLINRLKDENL